MGMVGPGDNFQVEQVHVHIHDMDRWRLGMSWRYRRGNLIDINILLNKYHQINRNILVRLVRRIQGPARRRLELCIVSGRRRWILAGRILLWTILRISRLIWHT